MPPPEQFEIEVGSGVVRGSLRCRANGAPAPAALLCGDPAGSAIDHAAMLVALADYLAGNGVAAVCFTARTGDPDSTRDARSVIDDAAAVLQWMLRREDLDPQRIGVLGCCLGAIASATLAAEDDRVNRLCLLAPVTGEDVLSRIEKANGLPTLVDPLELPGSFLASLAEMTPTEDVARRGQPTLVIRGAADRIVPAASVKPFIEAVEMARPSGHVELIARAGHELASGEARAVCFARVARFFEDMTAPASSS